MAYEPIYNTSTKSDQKKGPMQGQFLVSLTAPQDGKSVAGVTLQLQRRALVADFDGYLNVGDVVMVALALQVYATLGDELDLPGGPAHGLARTWTDKLPLPERDAVERAVQDTLARLRRAARSAASDPAGDYRLPAPTGPLGRLRKLRGACASKIIDRVVFMRLCSIRNGGEDHLHGAAQPA